jgi:hypothetical protein
VDDRAINFEENILEILIQDPENEFEWTEIPY